MKVAHAIASAVLFSVSAWGTTIKPMSVEELAQAASRIVEVQVLESHAVWNPRRTKIYTVSKVSVATVLKGGNEREITIRQPGGSLDGYTMKVSGVQALRAGEETMMFLKPSPQRDGTWSVVGLMQGHFRIYEAAGQRLASNGISPRVTRLHGGKTASFKAAPATLHEIESRVQGALAK